MDFFPCVLWRVLGKTGISIEVGRFQYSPLSIERKIDETQSDWNLHVNDDLGQIDITGAPPLLLPLLPPLLLQPCSILQNQDKTAVLLVLPPMVPLDNRYYRGSYTWIGINIYPQFLRVCIQKGDRLRISISGIKRY